MRIRRPRNLTGFQLGLVTFLGVLGGIYIWKPLFAPQETNHIKSQEDN